MEDVSAGETDPGLQVGWPVDVDLLHQVSEAGCESFYRGDDPPAYVVPVVVPDQTLVEDDQLADSDARIANLEEAIGARAAEALRAGLSQETNRRAVTQLEQELDALRRHRAQLHARADRSAAESERTASLAKLAEVAHKRLDNMSSG